MATRLWEMDACELARLVGARLVSCREVVEAHLARIDQVNPAINASAVILGEQARTAADAADAAIGAAARPDNGSRVYCGQLPVAGLPTRRFSRNWRARGQ